MEAVQPKPGAAARMDAGRPVVGSARTKHCRRADAIRLERTCGGRCSCRHCRTHRTNDRVRLASQPHGRAELRRIAARDPRCLELTARYWIFTVQGGRATGRWRVVSMMHLCPVAYRSVTAEFANQLLLEIKSSGQFAILAYCRRPYGSDGVQEYRFKGSIDCVRSDAPRRAG